MNRHGTDRRSRSEDFGVALIGGYGLSIGFTLIPVIPLVTMFAAEFAGWHPGWTYACVAGLGPVVFATVWAALPGDAQQEDR